MENITIYGECEMSKEKSKEKNIKPMNSEDNEIDKIIEKSKEKELTKKKELIGLIIGWIGAMAGLVGMAAFNNFVLMSLSLGMRMVLIILMRGALMLIPFIIMLISRDRLRDYGFTKDKLGVQIGLGFILGFAVSLMLTFIPILAGKGIIVDNGRRYVYAWQFLHEFIYCMAIGLSEEYVFRGFIYEKVRRLSSTNSMAVIISSILFGFMHLLGGNMIQVTLTALLGALFCYFRLKIKNCSLLSIIICHGVYDFMITVCSSAFMG